MTLTPRLLAALAAFVLSFVAQAAETRVHLVLPSEAEVDVDVHIPQGRPAGRHDIAVLIGNRNYRPGIPTVEFADNDLAVMRRYLERTMGYDPANILEERDATKGVFERLFGSRGRPRGQLADWVRKGRSRVFIYYVGHGAPDPDHGDGYFVPVDAEPDYIAATGYSLNTFYDNLRQVPAREMVVVLDACFSGRTQDGLLFKNVSPALLRLQDTPAGLTQGAVLSSAEVDQLAAWYPQKRHSLYTYHFLKGLQGAADADGDRQITTGEMQAYVAEEVPYWARRLSGNLQRPQVQGRKDIVIATYR